MYATSYKSSLHLHALIILCHIYIFILFIDSFIYVSVFVCCFLLDVLSPSFSTPLHTPTHPNTSLYTPTHPNTPLYTPTHPYT